MQYRHYGNSNSVLCKMRMNKWDIQGRGKNCELDLYDKKFEIKFCKKKCKRLNVTISSAMNI